MHTCLPLTAQVPSVPARCTLWVRPCTHVPRVPAHPSTHEQPWTWTLTVGLISTEVTRRAVLDPPSDAQTASQARPARAVGRPACVWLVCPDGTRLATGTTSTAGTTGPCQPVSQGSIYLDSQWARHCVAALSQEGRHRERERASKQASQQASQQASERASPGEPGERPDRPDDIRPWMQLNHRAHPPTPDPCPIPRPVRYSASTASPGHPGQTDPAPEPRACRRALRTGPRGHSTTNCPRAPGP